MTAEASPEQVVEAVSASVKYRHVWPEFTRRLAAAELAHGRSSKEAVKAVKNKLHQVGAAYSEHIPDYAGWLERLAATPMQENPEAFTETCQELMGAHASTRERLPILEEIYKVTLADLAPIHSILDAACGLNPLTAAWMPLAPGARYYACDIFLDLLDFLNGYFRLAGLDGEAFPCDLISGVPEKNVDVVLLMKALPCLEQADRHASAAILESMPARHALVSFPAQSLGGRARGMEDYYPAHFAALLEGRGWVSRRFDFETEIVFRLDRPD